LKTALTHLRNGRAYLLLNDIAAIAVAYAVYGLIAFCRDPRLRALAPTKLSKG
jgi:hypothetical protein